MTERGILFSGERTIKMTEIIDPHPNVIDDAQTMQVAPAITPRDPRCNCQGEDMHGGGTLPEDAPVLADGHRHDLDCVATNGQTRAVTAELNLARVSAALTNWARAALDRSMSSLALDRWLVLPQVRLRDAKNRPGFLRVDLRVTARVSSLDDPLPEYKQITEEAHALINMVEMQAAPAMVAGVFQAALGELVDEVTPRLRFRLASAGVLERADPLCAGALCVGCGNAICPRRRDRR